MFVAGQQQIEAESQKQQQQFRCGDTDRRKAFDHPLPCSKQNLKCGEQDERSDAKGADRFVFVVAIGVIPIRSGIGKRVGDQPGQAGEGVGRAVHGIGDDRQ